MLLVVWLFLLQVDLNEASYLYLSSRGKLVNFILVLSSRVI